MTEQSDALSPESTESAHLGGPAGVPRRSRLRAILVVVLSLAVAGAAVGVLWAWIAPPIHAVVALTHSGQRVHDYLGSEWEHFFVAPVLMLGLLGVLAVVASAVVWQWPQHRGPVMLVGLWLGLLVAAGIAAAVGALLVRLRWGALNFDAVPLVGEHAVAYVNQAPPVFFSWGLLQVAATLWWPVANGSLVYALLATANARDDLGAYLMVGRPAPARPVAPDAPEAAVS